MKLQFRKHGAGVEKYGSANRPGVAAGACCCWSTCSWCCWLSGISNTTGLRDPEEL